MKTLDRSDAGPGVAPALPRNGATHQNDTLAPAREVQARVGALIPGHRPEDVMFEDGIVTSARSASEECNYEEVIRLLSNADGSPRFPKDLTLVILLAHAYVESKLFGACIGLVKTVNNSLLYEDEDLFLPYVVALVETKSAEQLSVLVSSENALFASMLSPSLAHNIARVVAQKKDYGLLHALTSEMFALSPELLNDHVFMAHYTRACNYSGRKEQTVTLLGQERLSTSLLHDPKCMKNLAYALAGTGSPEAAYQTVNRMISGGVPAHMFRGVIIRICEVLLEQDNQRGASVMAMTAVRTWKLDPKQFKRFFIGSK